ncbi:4'-phosphopantetheinyl transferase family protein [Brachybacterium sp. GCM10030267]|uniref:4'-phosphopantetheinyl transferase family protein n=1 Tax=Brachybacterium sp. GCM10030267 TaxID=3273381 RepID=UPI00366AA49C
MQHHAADEDADAILRRRIAELIDVSEADVLVGRACPRCGSSRHGRPWARVPGRGDEVSVSLSRAGPHLVTAVTTEGAIGVDIESVAAVDAGWDPGLVLHLDEAGLDTGPGRRAALWCGKEAILKALGVGLATPMSTIRLADHPVLELPAPPGYRVACVIVAGGSGRGGSSVR